MKWVAYWSTQLSNIFFHLFEGGSHIVQVGLNFFLIKILSLQMCVTMPGFIQCWINLELLGCWAFSINQATSLDPPSLYMYSTL